MRTLLAGLLLTSALPAFADTFELDIDVTAALITGNGGVVTYASELALTPGRHTLISFLPAMGYQDTVLDTRIGDPASVRIAAQAAQRAFEQDYEVKQADVTAAQTQLKLLSVTAKNGFGSPDNGINAEQLVAVATALAETTKQATSALATAKTELLVMEPQREQLRKDVQHAADVLAALKSEAHQDLIQVTTQIEVTAAQTAKVEFDNLEPDLYRRADPRRRQRQIAIAPQSQCVRRPRRCEAA